MKFWRIVKAIYRIIKDVSNSSRIINSDGYVFLRKEKELEHRNIAKKILGRNLATNEIVHHINGRKQDNAIDNLCVMARCDHRKYHKWIDWKKEKIGSYPSKPYQKAVLVNRHSGILLENYKKTQKLHRPTTPDAFVQDSQFALRQKLFKELKQARLRLAKQRGIPSYEIFYDKELMDITKTMPVTESEMIETIGFGNYKRSGAYFLTIVKKFKFDKKLAPLRKNA